MASRVLILITGRYESVTLLVLIHVLWNPVKKTQDDLAKRTTVLIVSSSRI